VGYVAVNAFELQWAQPGIIRGIAEFGSQPGANPLPLTEIPLVHQPALLQPVVCVQISGQ
jgi:hypothetical protein